MLEPADLAKIAGALRYGKVRYLGTSLFMVHQKRSVSATVEETVVFEIGPTESAPCCPEHE